MKRLTILVVIFTLSKIGVTIAAPINGNSIQNFFLGNAFNKPATYNQVLALLIGPTGKPGPAGVAGRDGFNGINGLNGRNGIDGAPGPVGPQGAIGPQGPQGPVGPAGAKGDKGETGATGSSGPAGATGAAGQSVVVTALVSGDTNCPNGGSKFQVGATITFACNGAAGNSGSGGAGGSSGSSGSGTLEVTKCDDLVSFSLDTNFNNRFYLNSVTISQVHRDCNNLVLTMVFQIASPKPSNVMDYQANDKIYCEKILTGGSLNSDNNSFVMSADAVCRVNKSGNTLALTKIAIMDIESVIGFQIAAA